jgi:hypothetical protein
MKFVTYTLLFFSVIFFTFCTRQSPAETAEGEIDGIGVTVDYSSPRVKGRQGKIWGDMLPYGQVWRAGANEATVVTFDRPVLVEGQSLDSGSYSLFMIPGEQEWTVIFNTATDISGTEYESIKEQNVVEVPVQPRRNNEIREDLNYEVSDGELLLHWEYLTIPIEIAAGNEPEMVG